MAVDQTDRIDMIGIDPETGMVDLAISDHLNWGAQTREHLTLLQEKINTYLEFVESGEILDSYPKAKGRKVSISVIGKYPLSKEAKRFFEQAAAFIKDTGMTLDFQLLRSS